MREDGYVKLPSEWYIAEDGDGDQVIWLTGAGPSDDELIGYSVNVVTRNLHYDLRVCQNDVLYLTPEHRLGPLGLRLIRDTERHAREAGAKIMLWHAKQGTSLDGLLPRIDYQVQEIMYSRVL